MKKKKEFAEEDLALAREFMTPLKQPQSWEPAFKEWYNSNYPATWKVHAVIEKINSLMASHHQQLLEEMLEIVGEDEEKPIVAPPESEVYMYTLAQFNRVAGVNNEKARIRDLLANLKNNG